MSTSFGDLVRRARTALEMTQADLAKKMSVGATYVTMIEGGNRRPSMDFLAEMSVVVRIPLRRLHQALFPEVAVLYLDNEDAIVHPAVHRAAESMRRAGTEVSPAIVRAVSRLGTEVGALSEGQALAVLLLLTLTEGR